MVGCEKALLLASRNGNAEVVRELLKADVNLVSPRALCRGCFVTRLDLMNG